MQELADSLHANGKANPDGPDGSDTVTYNHFTSNEVPAPAKENHLKAPTLQQLLEARAILGFISVTKPVK
jgi:hypothetical protein